jgi:Ni/Co efflux regulator RcnB
MLKSAILAVSFLAAAPALAQSAPAAAPAQPQQTASADKKADPLNKIICRTEDTIGSRLKAHKVCATLREWKDQEDDNRLEVDRIRQGQGTGVPSG